MSDTDETLSLEFAYTTWDDSCQDPYNGSYQCRRPAGHDGDHAAGFGAARLTWEQDPPEGWFFDQGDDDEGRRTLMGRVIHLIGVGLAKLGL